MPESDNYLFVAALDFGTTYSGYAFSTRHEFNTDPTKIHSNPVWKAGSRALMSMKTPTSLLLDKNKEFEAFGYEAENMYAEAVLDEEQDDHYYFHRFKMNLHNNKNITSDMILEDITGKPLPAFEVFKLSIKALVDHLNDSLEKIGTGAEKNEVRWVLTVPAIWTDTAKQFMRSAAEAAGILPEKLILALEPETASIWCQYLPTEKRKESERGFTMTTPGTEYMVVDLGGGTADITVHRKVANNQLKERYRASGNDCGGISVDKRFFIMLEEIVGKPLMESFQREDPLAYLDLVREFEAVKRGIETTKKGKINLTIPYVSFDKKCQSFHNKSFESVLASSKYGDQIKLQSDKMRVNADIMRDIFKPTVDGILLLMTDILHSKTTEKVTHILMVGGFSECQIIQDAVRKGFAEKRIIIPEDAGLSVLKGAVLFGHNPGYVKSRVMRFTYGVKTHVKFDQRKFDEKNLVIIDGEEYCDNLFSKIVEQDENVEAGTVVKKSYYTPEANQKEMNFHVYLSEVQHPFYVTDEGCSLLCTPTITFPDTVPERRWVDVDFVLGKTEIELKAVDRISGEVIQSKINLI